MSENLHNIDDLFKKGLEEHSEVPSSSVWDNIDKTLDKKKVISISKKYNALKWAAAVLLLFSVGMAMYTLHVNRRNKELVKQNNEKNISQHRKSQIVNNASDSENTVHNGTLLRKPVAEKSVSPLGVDSSNSIAQQDNKSLSDNKTKPQQPEPETVNSNIQATDSFAINNPVAFKKAKNQSHISAKQNSRTAMVTESPETEFVSSSNDSTKAAEKYNENENKNKPSVIDYRNVYHNVAVTKEKNILVINRIPELEDATEISFVKPVLQSSITAFQDKLVSSSNSKARHSRNFNFKINKVPALTATLFFSPDLVATSLRNENIRYREEDSREIEKDVKTNRSTTLAALLDYKISNKLQIQSGITFSSWVTSIQPKKIYARPDGQGAVNYRYNCVAGYSYFTVNSNPSPVSGDSIEALGSNNTLQYIGIPLELKYVINNNRFRIIPGVGLSLNFLSKGQIKTTIATNTGNVKASSNTIEGLKSMYMAGLANVAFQYNLNKTFSLSFIPSARFSLSSINKNAPVKTNFYSLGFGAGLSIKL